jgi:hypothetical protein
MASRRSMYSCVEDELLVQCSLRTCSRKARLIQPVDEMLAGATIDLGLPDRPSDELVAEIRALRPHTTDVGLRPRPSTVPGVDSD